MGLPMRFGFWAVLLPIIGLIFSTFLFEKLPFFDVLNFSHRINMVIQISREGCSIQSSGHKALNTIQKNFQGDPGVNHEIILEFFTSKRLYVRTILASF